MESFPASYFSFSTSVRWVLLPLRSGLYNPSFGSRTIVSLSPPSCRSTMPPPPLSIFLWDYVDELRSFLHEGGNGQVIIVVQLARVKTFTDMQSCDLEEHGCH